MVDARTGRVPDAPLLFATLLVVGTVGGYSDWPIAAHRLLLGLVAMFALWGVNSLYYALWKRDAFGMGDAKWTLLAVAAFGVYPSVVAWIVGSWLGLSWIAIRWMIWRKPTGKAIHFAPFLFAGLVVGLCLKA